MYLVWLYSVVGLVMIGYVLISRGFVNLDGRGMLRM